MGRVVEMKSIKGKILIGFSIVLIMFALLSTYSYVTIRALSKELDEIASHNIQVLEATNAMSFSVANRAKLARDYILFDRDESKEQFIQETEKAIEQEKRLFELSKQGEAETVQQRESALQKAQAETAKWLNLVIQEIIPMYDAGKTEEALKLMEVKCLPYSEAAINAWIEVVNLQDQATNKQVDEMESEVAQSRVVLSVASLIAILSGIFIAIFQARRISSGIELVVGRLESVAKGNLQQEPLKVKTEDEVGRLMYVLNEMTQKLQYLIGQISRTSRQVGESALDLSETAEHSSYISKQVTSSIQEIAYGAETSSQSAKEYVTAMDSMSIQVQRIAEFSLDMANEAHKTSEQAGEGDNFVQKAISQMNSIEESVGVSGELVSRLGEHSKEIGQIVEVITAISGQTNLLALNASIEAARAGEHGRGFAVVAEEVRKLAEQSKHSADQITQLVTSIQVDTIKAVESMSKGKQDVAEGMLLINKTGEVFQTILQSIQNVSEKMEEVSSSTEHIAGTAEELNSTVVALSQISDQSSEHSKGVLTISEQQLQSMKHVNEAAATLTALSKELNEETTKFTY
ncbi:methyl-accepting chemotaxis protein [Bacillus sp. CGMCC 1.16541]|uniref:methyl-accepting chemotaxis protein n=1 Tax=Bacillus sp. CGMCC 1.16541 TaxID=2185143 RepID=UPI000D73718F|nr:methyl-accepting chemotaxis protein [Bacillus sp. CGMCC 1.16541]